MVFEPKEGKCFFVDFSFVNGRAQKKYFMIVDACQIENYEGDRLLFKLKIKECNMKYLRTDLRPVDAKNSKDFYDEDVYELEPFGNIKNIPSKSIFECDLQDKYIYKRKN